MHISLGFILVFQFLRAGFAAARPADPDFIIVGGGTAGCVIAARLCEALPSANIVLLERGAERNESAEFLVRAPRKAVSCLEPMVISESFESEPDPGLLGRRTTITTGKTLGGSSSINGMQWTIPVGHTVSRWGIQGLTSGVAQKYFQRVYNKVGFAQQPRPLRQIYADDYLEAVKKAGFKNEFNPFNRKDRNSVWQMSAAVTPTGNRIDSCTAYLTPALQGSCRGNLELIQGVTVTRALLDESTPPRATGVEYVRSMDTRLQNKIILSASKEVILSAGPYGSPKLLQLSGIGPKHHLLRKHVRPRVDLPVGERTQTRPLNSVMSLYRGVPLEPSNNSSVLDSAETLQKWKRGEASALGTTGFATIATLKKYGYSTMATAPDFISVDQPFIGSFCLTNPTAFGYLRIKNANPFSFPEVFLNVLGEKTELKRLSFCMKKFLDVHSKIPESFQLEDVSPTHGVNDTFLRQTTMYGYHFVGGCPVGAVLRPNLKVLGVESLRVIDTSVFKSMPSSSGPMSSTYMLAEFASEKIADKYRCEFSSSASCGTRQSAGSW